MALNNHTAAHNSSSLNPFSELKDHYVVDFVCTFFFFFFFFFLVSHLRLDQMNDDQDEG